YGTDSLTVMARRALVEGLSPDGPFAVAVDARRGMVYFGLFGADASRLDGPRLSSPGEAGANLPPDLMFAIGNGAKFLVEATDARDRMLTAAMLNLQPGAMALAALAADSSERLPILRPLYLRPPDARPQNAAVERRR
ncbi:MAG: hypothetical protein ACTSYK_02775, partial [Alphaproteobacteria bacterium]